MLVYWCCTLENGIEGSHQHIVCSLQSSISGDVGEICDPDFLIGAHPAGSNEAMVMKYRELGTQASISHFSWMPSAIFHAVYVNDNEIL